MLDGMEALLRGEVPPPAVASLLGTRLVSFAAGEALVQSGRDRRTRKPDGHRARRDFCRDRRRCDGLGIHDDATVEMKVNVLRAFRTGRIAARALVKNAGRTLGLIACDVLDADGKLVAHAVSTRMILRAAQAEGR